MPARELLVRYEDDLALFPGRWHRLGLALGGAVTAVFLATASGYWLGTASLAATMTVGAVGLMILTGFTGQISLGHAAFLALGAYTAAILGNRWGVPFFLVLPAAGLLAATVGLAVGPFALRLSGLYLAIVTLGLMFLTNHLLLSFPELTGGPSGIVVPMHTGFGGGAPGGSMAQPFELGPVTITFEHELLVLYLLLAAASLYVAKNVRRSNTGRAMMAVRDHDLAAAVLGVRPAPVKILAFGLSSFFGGLAGAMFAFQQQLITVDPPFNLEMSVQYIAVIVLGGMGTVFGAVAGAVFFSFVAPLAERLGGTLPWVSSLSSAQQSTLLFSALVITALVLEPLGLFGVWLRVKRYFLAWPFRH